MHNHCITITVNRNINGSNFIYFVIIVIDLGTFSTISRGSFSDQCMLHLSHHTSDKRNSKNNSVYLIIVCKTWTSVKLIVNKGKVDFSHNLVAGFVASPAICGGFDGWVELLRLRIVSETDKTAK